MSQKYHRGDVVHVAVGPDEGMDHFKSGFDAVVMGSYRDQFGGDESGEDTYTVMCLETGGEVSWYYDNHLTFLRHGGESEIEGCREALRQREAIESNLPWIVASWTRIRENPSGATMNALMHLIGINEPWGRNGEGLTYYSNVHGTRAILDDALASGDLAVAESKIAEVREHIGHSHE